MSMNPSNASWLGGAPIGIGAAASSGSQQAAEPPRISVAAAAAQLRADPKKASLIVGLLAVMLVLWGRVLLKSHGGPASVSAAGPTAGSFLSSPGAADNASSAIARDDRHAALADAALRAWVAQPLPPAPRNLFAVPLDYYPRDGSHVDAPPVPPPVASVSAVTAFWDKLAKSFAARADEGRERQILVSNLQLRAATLRLQSTVMSEPLPQALVNGVVVHEGDRIDGFRVARIEPWRIVVEQRGVLLEIRLR